MTLRHLARGVALAVAVLGFPAAAAACPFCSSQGQTLSGEVNQADLIVLGTVKNSKRDPNDFTRGTTEIHIDMVIKPHEYLAGKKVLVIPRYVQVDPAAGDNKYLVFCSVYANSADLASTAVASALVLGNFANYQLDAYRGEPAKADSKLPEYLKGALAVRQKDTPARLRYFFNYLDSPELIVSSDAYMEFGNAEYKDVRGVAEKLPADQIFKWLNDRNTAPSRYGLYGLLYGHCGRKEDAPALRKLLDDPSRAYSSGLDGLLAGYILLDPKGGWSYLLDTIRNEKNEFPVRYAGLKVLRFFWESRPDVIPKARVLEGMKLLVAQPDLADLPIEDLRKWEQWDLTPVVLENGRKESHAQIPIVRRAVLRFALSAPQTDRAAVEYVEEARKTDPERVKMVEEMLRDEKPKPATTSAANGK